MAERLTRLIGDAIVALLEDAWPRIKAKVRELAEHLEEVVTPHPPMTLRTLDGEIVTGLLVLNRGQALIFVGVREPASPLAPQVREPFRDEEPLWPRDLRVDPYRRPP